MAWQVELTARAERNLQQVFEFINASDSATAANWFDGLQKTIESLDHLPERGATTEYDPNLRFLLYGNKPHIYRILYRINSSERRVFVVHVRHGARKPLSR